MSDFQQQSCFFDQLSKVLLRCWILGFVLLLIWFGAFRMAGETIYRLNGSVFELTRHEIQLVFYCGMGLFKLFILVFFFFPWLSLRLMLRNRKS